MRDNPMVERVALALCNAYRERGYQTEIDSLPEAERQDYLSAARRAIAAMREPTEAMFSYDAPDDAPRVHRRCHMCGGAEDQWPAMIDAALKEQQKP